MPPVVPLLTVIPYAALAELRNPYVDLRGSLERLSWLALSGMDPGSRPG